MESRIPLVYEIGYSSLYNRVSTIYFLVINFHTLMRRVCIYSHANYAGGCYAATMRTPERV